MDKGLTTGRQAASNEMEDEGSERASSGSWALMHLICGIGSDRDWAKNRTMDGGIHPRKEDCPVVRSDVHQHDDLRYYAWLR